MLKSLLSMEGDSPDGVDDVFPISEEKDVKCKINE